jgi:hypothetical protein
MSSMSFGGRLPDHRVTIASAAATGLVSKASGKLRITRLGEAFMDLNPEQNYELSEAQRAFLVERCVFAGPYMRMVAEILGSFREDAVRQSLFCDLRSSRLDGPLHQSTVSFLCSVGVLVGEGGVVWVAPPYRPHVSRLRARVPVSIEELEEALQRQRAQGLAAEEWAVEYERERLRKKLCQAEADAVQRLSDIDICAGYDIASFDGRSENFTFDRFIEVKSTTRPEPVFMWSRNEIETAHRLGQMYWLFVLTGFRPSGPPPSLISLRNPASLLGAKGRISLEPTQFRAELR